VHVAAVYDGGSMILYRNGLEVARRSHSGTIPDESTPVFLGAGDNGTDGVGEYTNGVFDDVRLYNRALSASEIQTLLSQAGGGANRELAAAAPLGAAPAGGSCGLLGMEVLGVFLIVRLRRKRSRLA